ncbi:uncharacterized protein V6R79_026393 [Siganus canaliculatus]
MWKVAVFAFLLLITEVCGNGADKTGTPVAKKSKPEQKVKTEEVENIPPAGDTASPGFSGKLLVIPMDGSHWLDLKILAQEMGRRGHRVTVVMPEVTMRMGPGKYYDTVTYPVPYTKATVDAMLAENKDMMHKSTQSFWETMKLRFGHMQKIKQFTEVTAERLLFNASLISYLAEQNFDAVLTDPMVPTGVLIAHKLGVPTINLLRAMLFSLDIKSAGSPSPPSYVPRFFTKYTDKMNFKQRTVNTLVALLEPLLNRLLFWQFDHLARQFLEEDITVNELLTESAVWLLRFDFVLEFPRPLMPNMVLVGGINCNRRKPLPDELQPWLSGEHGFIVFTLGSMMADMPEEATSAFLQAFKQIPQKVIWRYTGQAPSAVPDNVKMMEWLPQNDLLAHPGVRAFITHAGSHGIFEALCHAVPMVMMPIAGDQSDNAERLANKGAGVLLNMDTVTAEIIVQGLNAVINDSRYKENMQRLSAFHKDRPVEPLDLSVHWTEFVMRHKGAKHLRAAVHDLNWIQYYCLDVIALLVTIVLVFVILTVKCLKLCVRKLGRKRKQD